MQKQPKKKTERKPCRAEVMWAVDEPEGVRLIFTVKHTRWESIDMFMAGRPVMFSWRGFYREGYRCRKVYVVDADEADALVDAMRAQRVAILKEHGNHHAGWDGYSRALSDCILSFSALLPTKPKKRRR